MAVTETDPALTRLYADFEAAGLLPLWTQTADLMPTSPRPKARSHVWRWKELYPLAERAGELVPVGRGGERRAIALANPGMGGRPYATPTLWAAIQYLGPKEEAPAHRHTQGAFRFIVEGEGVWTVVDGDPVAMRRGDLLLTPSWAWHEHHNTADRPMAWLDGLDIPTVAQLDAGFFEFGPDDITDYATPDQSRAERLWAHPGLRPIAAANRPNSPLSAYRWAHTDAALAAQLELEDEGHEATIEAGHAGVRFTNPTNGRDALVTMRTEMHRVRRGSRTAERRTVGSAVWQVFLGEGAFVVDGERLEVATGDLVAVPSWCPVTIEAATELDLFVFNDTPIYEALNLARSSVRR
ncbi:MAG: cupin domain-containing protein [Streptosporangiales bacterium]|nr:cupin domain-containing protein [Streptosporangiales bacterium]